MRKNGEYIDPESLNLDGLRVLGTAHRSAFAEIRQKYDAVLDAIALPEVPAGATSPPAPRPWPEPIRTPAQPAMTTNWPQGARCRPPRPRLSRRRRAARLRWLPDRTPCSRQPLRRRRVLPRRAARCHRRRLGHLPHGCRSLEDAGRRPRRRSHGIGRLFGTRSPAAMARNVITKRAPWAKRASSTQARPPCACAIWATNESPMPLPR